MDSAAEGYISVGEVERAAKLLEAHHEPIKAGQVLPAPRPLEKATFKFQVAGRWLEAAELWQQLDQPLHQARAWEQYARFLSANEQVSDERRARAWEVAAKSWRDLDEVEAAEACHVEVARYGKLPHLSV